MKRALILLGTATLLAFWFNHEPSVDPGPGAVAPETPIQGRTDKTPISHQGYTIHPLASFDITARVLSKRPYSSGRESDLSPVDVALGWGPMSDSEVLQHISISQSNRWYRWQVQEFPIPRRAIETNSANMHLIPATDQIAAQMKQIKAGHVISMVGKLVRVQAPDGWHWNSSMTRKDTGGGACELIWVESLVIQ